MSQIDTDHKLIHMLGDLWPYISAFFLTLVMITKLWYSDRQSTKRRINTLEKLAISGATKQDLIDCKKEVDKQDTENFRELINEVKILRKEATVERRINQGQHQDIMKQVIELHSGDNN